MGALEALALRRAWPVRPISASTVHTSITARVISDIHGHFAWYVPSLPLDRTMAHSPIAGPIVQKTSLPN